MARGFESKSAQSAKEDADAAREAKGKRVRPPEEIEKEHRIESLMLSRKRIERELAETSSDLRRSSLQAALAHLDAELAKLT